MNIYPDKNFYPDKLWFRIHEDDASLVSIVESQEKPADVEYVRRDVHDEAIGILNDNRRELYGKIAELQREIAVLREFEVPIYLGG